MHNRTFVPRISALSPLMRSIFEGDTVRGESVMFLDKTDEKTLLFPIERVISITSYDGVVYE